MSLKRFVQTNPLFPYANVFRRAFKSYRSYIGPILRRWVQWLFSSREDTNLTYNLSPVGRSNLISGIAAILDASRSQIESYFFELEHDAALRSHILDATRQGVRALRSDEEVRFGKRLAWYAFARAKKPGLIVETGVDKGLGSVVLCAALLRNAEEGSPGRYYGTDINPEAGQLLCGVYRSVGTILYGDSITSLSGLEEKIGIFINDSDHSDEYEGREYDTIRGKLSANAVVVGDNSHVTTKLAEFAGANGWHYIFLHEQPDRHWYPGGGLGVAYRSPMAGGIDA